MFRKKSLAILFLLGVIFLAGMFAERNKIYKKIYLAFNNKTTEGLSLEVINSRKDGNAQQVLTFKSKTRSKTLIVSLHGWREKFDEYDRLADMAIANDFNYIRPTFRGQNNKPDACCSDLVMTDLDEAIDRAKEDQNWIEDIYVIGRSGGGYAGSCMLMKSKHKIKHFFLWSSMTNLVTWYNQQVNRSNALALEVLACTASKNNVLNISEAENRSSFFNKTPVNKLKHTKVSLFAGIHDKTVPITQSINFYHKLISDSGATEAKNFVSNDVIIKYTTRSHKEKTNILYSNQYENIDINIFNGGHVMDYDYMESYFSSLNAVKN